MGDRKLTPKQQLFISLYLIEPNASKAAAGSYPKTKHPDKVGSQLLGNARVKKAIEAGQAVQKAELEAKAKNKGITKEKWLASVAELAFADIDTFVQTDIQTGRTVLRPTKDRPKGSGRLVRKITIQPSGAVALELHPKHPAQELLAKSFGWIYDKVEHSGSINMPTASETEMKRIMADPDAAKMARELAKKLSIPGAKKPEGGENV